MVRKAAAVLALLACLPARSAEIEGVRFRQGIELAGQTLPLRGAGLLRWRWVFKGYVAALYLPADTPASDVLGDVPRRLEIEYFWAISGRQFREAAEDLLADTLSPAEQAALAERLARLNGAYRDVEPGDRYALDYVPGTGTTLRWNGAALITVPGADLASAYFSMWLGDSPLDASLRTQLLGLP